MKNFHVPAIGKNYWMALVVASVVGANLGDFLSDVLGWGHLTGLPLLAGLFALILLLERFDKIPHIFYYWLAILVVRAAATNIGDTFRDFGIIPPVAMAGLVVLFVPGILLWKAASDKTVKTVPSAANVLSTNPWYWASMLVAGTLGTVLGDFCSASLGDGFGIGFFGGNLVATLVLGLFLGAVFVVGRKDGWQLNPFYYWFTIVVIRSAGTAAGDSIAHSFVGLPLSTVLTAAAFFTVIVLFRDSKAEEGVNLARKLPVNG